MTVLQVIQRSSEYLEKKGIDSPRLQAELLLAHVLKLPRLNLYLDFARELAAPEQAMVGALVQRRGQREPLQYIVGTTSFCGLELAVTQAVLIPRPETEALAEQAWAFLAQLRRDRPVVLDFATGSGCLAIAIAAKFPLAEVHAIDLSEPALGVARTNAKRLAASVRFHRAASIAKLGEPALFDLIVSNPPYIPSGEIASLQPEVRDHEPKVALDGGPDGLTFHRLIAREAATRLNAEGAVLVELADSQADAAREVFAAAGWLVEKVVADYAGTPRILIARREK